MARHAIETGSSVLSSVENLEQSEQPDGLHDVFCLALETCKFDAAAGSLRGAEKARQDAQTAAVDEIDSAQVENYLLVLRESVPDEVAQVGRFVAQHEPAAALNDGDVAKPARNHLQRHGVPFNSVAISEPRRLELKRLLYFGFRERAFARDRPVIAVDADDGGREDAACVTRIEHERKTVAQLLDDLLRVRARRKT